MKLSIFNDPTVVKNIAPAATMEQPPFEVVEYQDEADLNPAPVTVQ